MITIVVPTHSYLRKFAQHRANSQTGNIRVSTSKSWGIALWKILSRREFRRDARRQLDYEDQIVLEISEYMYSRSGFTLTDENVFLFNRHLKSQFEEALFDHITINITSDFKTNIEQQIITYLNFYNITERERSLDSLLKAYQRWRTSRNYLLIKV